MATREFEAQPAQDLSDTNGDMASDYVSIPMEKSSVLRDPKAPNQTSKFGKEDHVHMSIIDSGIRKKGSFTVHRGKYNQSGGYWEYQLMSENGKLYQNGAYIRDRDLRMEKKDKK